MRALLSKVLVTLLFLSAVSAGAMAQGVTRGSFELSADGGISNIKGIDNKKGHGVFGFDGGYNITRNIAVVAEYKYMMLGSLSEGGATGNENLQNFGAAARFSLLRNRIVVPYVVIGGGGNRENVTATDGNVSVSAHQSGAYIGGGGGVSLYIGGGFGVRPEFRYERQHLNATTVEGIPVNSTGQNDAVGTVGIFYQFGGRSRR